MLIIGPSDLTGKVVWPWLFVSGSVISVLEKLSMDFLGKIFYGKKWSKWHRKGSFKLSENSYLFLLKMFLDEKIVFNILLYKPHVLGN